MTTAFFKRVFSNSARVLAVSLRKNAPMIRISVPLSFIFLQDSTAQVQLDSVTCGGANRDFIIVCLVVGIALGLLGLLAKTIFDRRLVWTSAWRLIVTIILVFAVGTALVSWNPTKTYTWLDCIADPEFSRFMLMGTVSTISRGLVMGGLVSTAFLILFIVVASIVGKMRKS